MLCAMTFMQNGSRKYSSPDAHDLWHTRACMMPLPSCQIKCEQQGPMLEVTKQ